MVTDTEREEHAARLRGLLYLAYPEAPAAAITATARAIAQRAEEMPLEAVPEAEALMDQTRFPRSDSLYLRGADLSGADLHAAILDSANLGGADLTDADLSRARLRGADLTHANLTGAKLTGAKLDGAKLSRANLYRAKLDSPFTGDAKRFGVNLTGADLTLANLTDADLTAARLTGANLTGAVMRGANLTDANLRGANLTDANLTNAVMRGANLIDAHLDGTLFVRALFMRLPSGATYNLAGATWNLVTRWPAELESVVLEQSDEVSPGVYQVRGGTAPDRSGSIRV
ncbi:pentapeptide repeat-containing protein [Streptomyces sp. NBC_01361]|uniref:pentapeptide repeat-containing protein n=1 Tax=Streptomyces sp. NBC_01361 TaxID=2903838 RepID=UPI002E2FBFD4|nr:pentapeptide repeat-containing protein [Streptomyces sp. NBC_01361]